MAWNKWPCLSPGWNHFPDISGVTAGDRSWLRGGMMTLPPSAFAPNGINPSLWLRVQLWRGGQTDWPSENHQIWTPPQHRLPIPGLACGRPGTWQLQLIDGCPEDHAGKNSEVTPQSVTKRVSRSISGIRHGREGLERRHHECLFLCHPADHLVQP